MRTVFSCHLPFEAPAATCFIAAIALFFVAGIMPVSTHAQTPPQPNAEEENRVAPLIDARDMPAQKLFSEAVLLEQESLEKAVTKYEEVIQRFARSSSPGSRQFAARALLNKGSILGKLGNDKEAIFTFERTERNFGNEKTPAIREVLASALVSKAETFYKQGDIEKTLDTYAQLERQFDKDENDFIARLIDITKWRVTEIRVSNKMVLSP